MNNNLVNPYVLMKFILHNVGNFMRLFNRRFSRNRNGQLRKTLIGRAP